MANAHRMSCRERLDGEKTHSRCFSETAFKMLKGDTFTPHSDTSNYTWDLYFTSDDFIRFYGYRYYGRSVRPVRDAD